MIVINKHEGKRKGQKGITVHLLKQGSKEQSKSITVHGMSINQLYEKLMFYFKTLSVADNGIEIIIKGENKNE